MMIPEGDYAPGNPVLAGSNRLVVLTGCSGSGKSSLLAALAKRGYATVSEAGHQIVREQMAIGGRALPWADAAAFVELAVSRAACQFNTARPANGPVIFDRSVVDPVSFLDHKELDVPPHLHRALDLYRYARRVLVTPPWQAIYRDDGERMKSFEEAVAEYGTQMRWYRGQRYEPVEIPTADIETRADFCVRLLDAG